MTKRKQHIATQLLIARDKRRDPRQRLGAILDLDAAKDLSRYEETEVRRLYPIIAEAIRENGAPCGDLLTLASDDGVRLRIGPAYESKKRQRALALAGEE